MLALALRHYADRGKFWHWPLGTMMTVVNFDINVDLTQPNQ